MNLFQKLKRRLWIFLLILGPATITAMADNDASGVATYSIAGAKLGYPVLFTLFLITILLGITQEMGMRLAIITRKGLGGLIRERWGIRISVFVFLGLIIANMGTIIVDLAAVKVTSSMLGLPEIPFIIAMIILIFLVLVKGNYKFTEKIMLGACFFYVVYIFSAFKANPDWPLAISNLFWPHGLTFTKQYLEDYLIIGLGVLGTTVTPWGQFVISSLAYDKNTDPKKIKYAQFESYWGAFLTDFFSFFMIVATAATLFKYNIPLVSGSQAALAIQPFAGKLAGLLFALGILNAGFMGVVIVSLSTSYAFSEFFGLTGSLDSNFTKGKFFYLIFLCQLIIAALVVILPFISLFHLAIATQVLNAMILPLIFYFLINLTGNPDVMGSFTNSKFQKWFTIMATIVICLASIFTLASTFF